MKSLIKHAVHGVLGLTALISVASAEVALKDISEIVGTWKLESVSAAIDKARIPENRIWEFRPDGVIVTSGFNRHFNRNDSFQFTYKVTNGKIITDDPGRAGKTIDYAVYKKEGDELILKGGLEGFYFFKKQ
ncbi:MAG: lipocalin family protein [Methylococcaceae bacterium]|jgi:hypothetical protein|nr:lipocalin family protein [Methylococcaceae bacterium]